MVVENSKLKIILAFFVLLVIGLTSSFGMSFWRDNQAPEKDKGEIVSLKENKIDSRNFWLPSGKETYRIAQASEVWPKILEATIDPPDVHVGDKQKLTVIVQSPEPIEFVEARTQLDHEFKVIPLKFVGEVANNELTPNPYVVENGKLVLRLGGLGIVSNLKSLLSNEVEAVDYPKLKYEAEWIVYDTHDTNYKMTFVAKNTAGQESSVTLAWSDACSIPKSGAWSMSGASLSSCTISVNDGIESGNASINQGTLTLNAGFAVNQGYSVQISGGGSVAIGGGGYIQITNIWGTDGDSDTYMNMNLVLQDNSPGGGYVRRSSATNIGDCNDNNANIWQYKTGGWDGDGDAYIEGNASYVECVGPSIVQNNMDYYRIADGSYAFIDMINFNPGTADCDVSDGNIWVPYAGGKDSDHDGYISGSSYAEHCVGGTQVFNGRDYYHDPLYDVDVSFKSWLRSSQALGLNDSNDANAGVH